MDIQIFVNLPRQSEMCCRNNGVRLTGETCGYRRILYGFESDANWIKIWLALWLALKFSRIFRNHKHNWNLIRHYNNAWKSFPMRLVLFSYCLVFLIFLYCASLEATKPSLVLRYEVIFLSFSTNLQLSGKPITGNYRPITSNQARSQGEVGNSPIPKQKKWL